MKNKKNCGKNLSDFEKEKRKLNFLEVRKLTSGSKGKTWKLSEETKLKMSCSKKGWVMTDETRKKLSEIAKNRKPRKHSPETIQKMKESALKRTRKIGT